MRRAAALLFVGTLVFSFVSGAAPSQTAQAAPPPIAATPSTPLRSEKFTVTGSLKTKVVRPVTLQVKSGKAWKKAAAGKTDAAGRFALTASTIKSSIIVRVVAKKVKIKGKKYAAVTTKSRTIKTSTAQSATLSMPKSAQVTEAVNASLTFTPARAGRPVQLEALVSGAWTRIATGFETSTGTSVIQLTATTIGTFRYRATAPSHHVDHGRHQPARGDRERPGEPG